LACNAVYVEQHVTMLDDNLIDLSAERGVDSAQASLEIELIGVPPANHDRRILIDLWASDESPAGNGWVNDGLIEGRQLVRARIPDSEDFLVPPD
jgi:hypothetical protein